MFDYLPQRAQANANARQHAGFEDFAFAIQSGEHSRYATLTDGLLSLKNNPPAGV